MHKKRITKRTTSCLYVLFQSSLGTEIVLDVQLTRKSLPQHATPTFMVLLKVYLRYLYYLVAQLHCLALTYIDVVVDSSSNSVDATCASVLMSLRTGSFQQVNFNMFDEKLFR